MNKKELIKKDLTLEIWNFLSENNLTRFHSMWNKSKDENEILYYYIIFTKEKMINGKIEIYDKNFFVLDFENEYESLPHKDKLLFNSKTKLMNFIKYAFIDLDEDKAYGNLL